MFKYLLYFINAVLYLVIVGLWISIPEHLTLNMSVTVFNLTLTVILIIIDNKKYKKFYTSTQFKGLTSALTAGFLMFCIIGLINYLAFKHPLQFDLTKNKMNSLSEKSVDILSKIKSPIMLIIFAHKTSAKNIIDLAVQYRVSGIHVDFKFVDVELNPALVKRYNITKANTVVIEHDERKVSITDVSEKKITNGIVKLTREKDPLIYYSIGHQELLLEEKDKTGLSFLDNILKDNYLNIVSKNLSILKRIPKEVDALIIWGARSDLTSKEIFVVDEYLQSGGKLLISIDPRPNGDKTPELRKFLKKWNIDILNNLVVDKIEHISGSQGTVPLVKTFANDHWITNGFHGQVFFPLTSSVNKVEGVFHGEFTPIAFSSPFPASWAESNFNELFAGKVVFSEGKDRKGPIALGGTWTGVTGKNKHARIVAFGNSTFVQNSYNKFLDNFQLFTNSLIWLIEDNELPSMISDKKSIPVFIGKTQISVIFYFSVIFAPIILFALSFYFYKRKQKL